MEKSPSPAVVGIGWKIAAEMRQEIAEAAAKLKDEETRRSCDTIFALLHSVDPHIAGFIVTKVDDNTGEWEVETFYDNGEQGHVWGEGVHIVRMTGGSNYDITSKKDTCERLEYDSDHSVDRLFEPRE